MLSTVMSIPAAITLLTVRQERNVLSQCFLCFSLNDEEIKADGPQQFIDTIHELITCALDNDLSNDVIRDLVDRLLNKQLKKIKGGDLND